ncbi:MAG: ATP synthase F1 subunit delta [bacterium]|nr:ATP synthase F1 subunit delta [bacterium]
MRFTPKQLAIALQQALETSRPEDSDKVLDNFVAVLKENKALHMFEQASAEFHKLELEEKGIKEVVVKSAKPLNKSNEQEIVNAMNKIVNSKVELKKQIDESLIGGVLVSVDDTVIDASVKNQLEQLKNNLSR